MTSWRLLMVLVLAVTLAPAMRPMAEPQTAGPVLTANPAECEKANAIDVWWVRSDLRSAPPAPPGLESGLGFVAPGGMRLGLTRMWTSPVVKACRWVLPVLEPGTYVVALRGPDGSRGGAQFVVAAGGPSPQVSIPPPTAKVEGFMLYNGKPLSSITVQFWRVPSDRDGARAPVTGTTDAHGHYALSLDGAGQYCAVTKGQPRVTQLTAVSVGANTCDIVATGAELDVAVRGWDGQSPTRIALWSDADHSAKEQILGPGGLHSTRIVDLPEGTYHVVAYQDNGLVSRQAKDASITLAPSVASTDLDLVPNRSIVRIHDDAGRVVPGVQLTGWIGRDAFTHIAGDQAAYSLAGIPPGTEIRMRPPGAWVPACRVAPLDETVDLTLSKGRRVDVVFERHGIGGPIGTLLGMEGSNCPVPLDWFQFTRTSGLGAPTQGVITNFPLSRDLMFTFGGLSQTVSIPSTGPVVIR
jgi:hypothetical protein